MVRISWAKCWGAVFANVEKQIWDWDEIATYQRWNEESEIYVMVKRIEIKKKQE